MLYSDMDGRDARKLLTRATVRHHFQMTLSQQLRRPRLAVKFIFNRSKHCLTACRNLVGRTLWTMGKKP